MRRPDRERRAKMPVRLDLNPDLHRRLRLKAAEANQPMSTYVFELIKQDLQPTNEEKTMTHRQKPNFATRDQWMLFNQLNPIYRCVRCGDTDERNATVDHTVARQNGCPNAIEFWQWMCRSDNSRKGIKDDPYWAQPFFFDQTINLDALRVAQRSDCWDRPLSYSDYFSRPFSQLSGKILIFSGIVGCGKTLFPPVLGCSLNHIIRRDCGVAYPRVDRILVLTKEQSIRDQLAVDLATDLRKYGIMTANPNVGVIGDPSSEMLRQIDSLKKNDIWVSCIHMLFDTKDGPRRENVAQILAMFPLIVFDEPQFASDQVRKLVDQAHVSLSIGLTGSPIDRAGEVLKKFFLFSLYDYDTACSNDQSMKLVVSPDDPEWKDMVTIMGIESADTSTGAGDCTIDSCGTNRYNANIRPAITVAEKIVSIIHGRDMRSADGNVYRVARHRPQDAIADVVYPSHAMIVVGSIVEAKMLCDTMNKKLDSNRQEYPRNLGYAFDYVVSDSIDGSGDTTKARRLTQSHGWFWGRDNDGKLSSKSIRFLVVVDMGREGVNNPYCNIIGVADSNRSEVGIVQRVFGRQIRAVIRWDKEGRLHVPRAELDMATIITHETYNNINAIASGARFVLDMEGHLSDMATIDDLINGKMEETIAIATPDTVLTPAEKIAIIGTIGEIKIEGGYPEENIDKIGKIFGGSSPAKETAAKEFAAKVIRDPSSVHDSFKLVDSLDEIPRVMWEHLNFDPTDEELKRFILTHKSDFAPELSNLAAFRRYGLEFYRDHYRQFRAQDIPSKQTTSRITRGIAHRLMDVILKGSYTGDKSIMYKTVNSAARMILGVPKGVVMSDASKYGTPECHAILSRPEVRREIEGFAIKSLVVQGYCPTIAAALAKDGHND